MGGKHLGSSSRCEGRKGPSKSWPLLPAWQITMAFSFEFLKGVAVISAAPLSSRAWRIIPCLRRAFAGLDQWSSCPFGRSERTYASERRITQARTGAHEFGQSALTGPQAASCPSLRQRRWPDLGRLEARPPAKARLRTGNLLTVISRLATPRQVVEA